MLILKVAEFAVGTFCAVFVVWQIIWPLLCGRKPFTKVRLTTEEKGQNE